ncbi:hypothetical protein D3C71_2125330 [compost metagenome]
MGWGLVGNVWIEGDAFAASNDRSAPIRRRIAALRIGLGVGLKPGRGQIVGCIEIAEA